MLREEFANAKLNTTASMGEGSIGRIISWFTMEQDPEYVYFVVEDGLGYPWTYREKFLKKYFAMTPDQLNLVTAAEVAWDEDSEYRKSIQKQIEEHKIQ